VLGGLGLLFVLVWGYLLYVRWEVARRLPPRASDGSGGKNKKP
jgi:hypothetical protein